jgi:hypothetical protein
MYGAATPRLSTKGAGSTPVPAKNRSALLLADEPARVERFVAPLRRANLAIARAPLASEAERMAHSAPYDLVFVVLPAIGAERFLRSVRAPECASRCASVLVVAAGDELGPADLELGRHANRLLPGDGDLQTFQQELTALLDVAPRAEIADGARLELTLQTGEHLELWIENLSTSGMLMRALQPLAVGTVFGFALELQTEREPIRGRARVVRVAEENQFGHCGVGARFLALGGEAPQRLEELVQRTREGAPGAHAAAPPDQRVPDWPLSSSKHPLEDPIERPAPADVARSREELADLTPALEEVLERGLLRRLNAAEWYVTGAELGLESLRAFSTVLASVYENRVVSREAERRLADLVEVRRQLAEFGRPQQDVATRVRIMLALRPALERLLRELAETGAAAGTSLAAFRFPGVISQAVVEIKRLVGARRGLASLSELLAERQRFRLLPIGSITRRSPEQIDREYGALAAGFGIALTAERLGERRSLAAVALDVARETRELERRLETVHRKTFSLRFRSLATNDIEADLQDPKLHRVLVETLAAGAQYLSRAYGAYRHALEVLGEDPALIERVERLGATIVAADRATELSASV